MPSLRTVGRSRVGGGHEDVVSISSSSSSIGLFVVLSRWRTSLGERGEVVDGDGRLGSSIVFYVVGRNSVLDMIHFIYTREDYFLLTCTEVLVPAMAMTI